MPTPCTLCQEVFDLDDGRAGLTHSTIDITICQSCFSNQEAEKERVDKIRDFIEEKEYRINEIECCDLEISEAERNKSDAEDDLKEVEEGLDVLNYVGDSDDYHEAINRFY